MKTADLIKALTADRQAKPAAVERMAALILPLVALGAALLVLLSLGPRAGLTSSPVLLTTAMKWAISLPLALGGLFMALKLAHPLQFKPAALLGVAFPAVLLIAMMIWDISQNDSAGWQTRMIGLHGLECLFFVPLFSAIPLAAMIYILRQGAVLRPNLAALAASLTATGLGATVYELHCTDDSPLFMGLWYVLGLLIVIGIGQIVAARTLKW